MLDSTCKVAKAVQTAKDLGQDYLANEYSDILGSKNFFLEIQDHGLPEQKEANKHLLEVAKITGLPLVAINDVHYLHQKDHEAHDVLIGLQHSRLFSDTNRMKYTGDQFYMKSGAEMERLFLGQPEALANTVEIARRCNVEFEFDLPAERFHFPTFFPLPENTTNGSPLDRDRKERAQKALQTGGLRRADHQSGAHRPRRKHPTGESHPCNDPQQARKFIKSL